MMFVLLKVFVLLFVFLLDEYGTETIYCICIHFIMMFVLLKVFVLLFVFLLL